MSNQSSDKQPTQSDLQSGNTESGILKTQLDLTTNRLLSVQRIAQLGFWDWNIETSDLYWSEEIYTLFGLSPDEFGATYPAFLQAVHPDDRKLVEDSVNAAVNDGAEYNIEHRLVQPDGTIIHVNEQGAVTRNDKGEPIRMLGTVINISDRKKAEELRQKREAEFKSLWEAAFDGMITADSDGLITLVNSSAEKLFGYKRDELIGQPVEILVPTSLQSNHIQHRNKFHDKPIPRSMGEGLDLEGMRKNGEQFPLEISLTPIEIKDRQEVLVEIQDITARKNLEQQLQQSQKLEAVGQLAGGIAHDLNNYLTAMMGYTDISLMVLGDDHECTNHLGEVLKSAERAKTMIGRILAFTRQQTLQPILLNVTELVNGLDGMLQKLLREHVELIHILDSDLPQVHVDPGQLEQVIVNLVVNASDAMPDGGKIIVATSHIELDEEYVAEHKLAKTGHYIELSVSDSGTGMPPEVRDKIFDPFYTTKELGKGTGLGLAMVYGVITQSKGDITVYSEPGEGTTFKIYLPVVTTQAKSIPKNKEEVTVRPGTGTIILVEDNEGVRSLAKRLLESNGYQVHEFESAEEALEAATKLKSLDLVITDVVLQGMKGPDFIDILKKTFPDVPVLFMSGYAGKAFELTNEMTQNTNFLSKPFTRKTLLQNVIQILDVH